MALPSSGAISLNQVNTELGRPAAQSINMNDSDVRKLAGVLSGAISMANLLGKAWWTAMSFAAYNVVKTLAWSASSGWTQQNGEVYLINDGINFNELNVSVNIYTPNSEVFENTLWTVTYYARLKGSSTEINKSFSGQSGGTFNWLIGSLSSYPEGFDRLRATYSIRNQVGHIKNMTYTFGHTSGIKR